MLVTRAREDQAALGALLRSRGAKPVALPCIEFEEPRERAPLDAALARLMAGERPDLIVLSSPQAAQRLFAELTAQGLPPEGLAFAAAGDGTARLLQTLGATDVVAPEGGAGAEALLRLLSARAAGLRVLLPRAEEGGSELPSGLRALGASVEEVTLYRTVPAGELDAGAEALLRRGAIAAIAFASGSAARGFASLFADDAGKLAAACAVACIGRSCADAALAAGLRVDAVGEGGLEGLVDALESALAAKSGR